MSFSPTDYLRHMLAEAEYAGQAMSGLTLEIFLENETLKRAIVRSIEIIGEATKHISDDFRSRHPQIDWRGMAGMRDRLIHGYFGVDYELVWDVAANKIPKLRLQLVELLHERDAR
ncbi:MAG: DUF86 domain-containing protein [Bythopirellula sp.]|nr:DUF86 domain-containing protein [Bythopirellula sp.]